MTKFKAIDFFCGAGGMTHGLKKAGIKVIAGVDIDASCKETYEYNNPESTFVHSDINNLEVEYFSKKFHIKTEDDNMIFIGCSPCQYYSIINTSRSKSLLTKDLLYDFGRFIDYYIPGYVLVENVPGIVTNKSSVLPKFLDFLADKGYKYIHKDIVDMSYYGVPQTRRRFSLIASRVNDIKLPSKDKSRAILKNYIGESNGFPVLEAGHKDYTDLQHSVAGLNSISLKRLKRTPKNGGGRIAWKDDKQLQLKCFVNRDDSFIDTFGRMSWDKPASTITTKFFSISNGRFAHPEENRALSIREGATLQTFPIDYVFKTNSIAETARLIGNAVPPEYARRLGLAIKFSGD